MARVEISNEIHRKVKAYAALEGLKVPEAYEKLLKMALKKKEK
jgi:hypothetical protein